MNNLSFFFSPTFCFLVFFPIIEFLHPPSFTCLDFHAYYKQILEKIIVKTNLSFIWRRKGQKKRTRTMWISEHFPGPAISCSLHCYEEIRLLERAVTGWVPPPPQVRYPALCPLLHSHTHFKCSWPLGILLSPDLTSLSTSPPSLIFLMLLGIPMYQG